MERMTDERLGEFDRIVPPLHWRERELVEAIKAERDIVAKISELPDKWQRGVKSVYEDEALMKEARKIGWRMSPLSVGVNRCIQDVQSILDLDARGKDQAVRNELIPRSKLNELVKKWQLEMSNGLTGDHMVEGADGALSDCIDDVLCLLRNL